MSEQEQVNQSKNSKDLTKGLIYGLGGAIILIIIILFIIFLTPLRDKIFSGDEVVSDGAELRITIVTKKDCPDCFDPNELVDSLRQYGIKEADKEPTVLYIDDSETKVLIDRYSIDKVPTLLISGELDKDENLQNIWDNTGDIIDGVYVLRQVFPPYVDVATSEVKGVVAEAIYLTDNSCDDCYNVDLHDNALASFGIKPQNKTTIDISSEAGQALVDQYTINLVPTVILRGDLEVYPGFYPLWDTLGTIAKDGTHVFTSLELMGTHKSLDTGEVIEVEVPTV